MLKKQLKKLNVSFLKKMSGQDGIGCPFHKMYGGLIRLHEYKDKTTPCERYCIKLCGAIFPKALNPDTLKGVTCPCLIYDTKWYVKSKFWKSLREARGE